MNKEIAKVIAHMEKMGDEFIEEGRHAFKSDCVGLILYGFVRELRMALTTNHQPPTTNHE